jgi:polyketide cyclase/dehydrase/lipid transport protein
MSLHRYRFTAVWSLRADVSAVYAAILDLTGYPLWWPDIRSVERIDDDTAEMVIRSTLPYALRFRMRRAVQDEHAGRVRVDLSGDVEGALYGALTATSPGTRLVIAQQVVANRPLLRTLAPVARPLLRANHTVMMWRGQRGLRDHLRHGDPS